MDPLEITWTCPNCKCENLDRYDLTAFPMCELCECQWDDWSEIVDPATIASGNAAMIAQETAAR